MYQLIKLFGGKIWKKSKKNVEKWKILFNFAVQTIL